MKETIAAAVASTVCYEQLERFARMHIQGWLQDLLAAEVTEVPGRSR